MYVRIVGMDSSRETQVPMLNDSQSKRSGGRLGGLFMVFMLAVTTAIAAAPLAVEPTTAAAVEIKPIAKANGFDPGNIVSDAVFFDGNALTAKQVQAFLKARVPKCNTSDSGPTCLRNHRQATPTIPADQYCKKYKGGANEKASKIIAKVGKACGVSQKALLVLLEKEQSLVTAGSTATNVPTEYKYRHATGFACPDTAPCDPQYEGIFYQLYYGARQYQRYASDSFYNWYSIGANSIMQHPRVATSNPGKCTRVNVNIKNQATVGLYFYTPYVPNSAALQNLYGTGDECSSYGNRNFWRIFTDWFGSTQVPVRGAIQEYWISHRSHAGALGVPRSRQQCNGKGFCVQNFQGGYVANNKKGKSFPVAPAVATVWQQSGGVGGSLGWPRKTVKCSKNGKRCHQRFDGGHVAVSPKGNFIVPAKLAKAWRKDKAHRGTVGMPRKVAKCNVNGRCRQQFANGFIANRAGKPAHVIPTGKRWNKNRKRLGFPKSDQKCSKANKKGNRRCVQKFAHGKIIKTRAGKVKVRVTKK